MVRRIVIKDFVENVATNQDGEVIFLLIKQCLDHGESVEVSFENIFALNSSFINAAFVQLLEHYKFDDIRKYVKFKDSTKQINQLIQLRFKDEISKKNDENLATI